MNLCMCRLELVPMITVLAGERSPAQLLSPPPPPQNENENKKSGADDGEQQRPAVCLLAGSQVVRQAVPAKRQDPII
jgi:hypothetical protein